MKKHILIFLIIFGSSILYAQTNINPDPNGTPWVIGGCSPISIEISETIPVITNLEEFSQLNPPSEYYNHQWPYFPPILDQFPTAACVSYAEIGYTFTYEMNRVRNVTAGEWDDELNRNNLYFPLYTFNFLNNGSFIQGTQQGNALSVIQDNGCPEFSVYYDPILDGSLIRYLYWMTGYDNYEIGMNNRINSMSYIEFADSYSSLEDIKHWIHHHFEGSTYGGLALISVNANNWNNAIDFLPESSAHAGEKVITAVGNPVTSMGHEITIVGYNDNIEYDLNGDGEITIDVNINGDDVVNLKDREVGAFLIANSSGVTWGNSGFIWLPYSLIVDNLIRSSLNDPILNRFLVCEVNENYESELTVKFSIDYPKRNRLVLNTGYSNKANMDNYIESANYNSFNMQGGGNKMRGAYDGPLEGGLDFGYHFINEDFGKIFFIVDENEQSNPADGTIDYFSIIDYRWGEEFELTCLQANVPIENNTETILYIDYDLIPHEEDITQNLLLDSDMVSRFNPIVNNGAELSIADGVKIDMYNGSTITIDATSSLLIGDNVQIYAKSGNCKLIIDGDVSFGNNLDFIAENGATLKIEINNNSTIAHFENATFENCELTSYAQQLDFIDSEFTDCGIVNSYRGEIEIDNTDFIESFLNIENSGKNDDGVSITYSEFKSNAEQFDAININSYLNYKVENCIININNGFGNGHVNGILIENSGGGSIYNSISNTEITKCLNTALIVYNSVADISNNKIHFNGNGVKLFDYSNVTITGNSSAQSDDETQQIIDNTFTEIYATYGSFPVLMEYNVIYDDDNMGYQFDPLVYYANTNSKDNIKYVVNNCWEDAAGSFDHNEDLYPPGAFISSPTWCPSSGGIPKEGAALLYETASTQIEAEEYSAAQSTLESIVTDYPESDFADAAVKELYSLERLLDNNYAEFQDYLINNPNINSDSSLMILADFLINKCNIELEEWQLATEHYENTIESPLSMEDSIFAIIDLGHLYFLMENGGNKSARAMTKYPEYQFEARTDFIKNRNYLLSLLPFKNSSTEQIEQEAVTNDLVSIIPNPSKGQTAIHLSFEEKALIEIRIFDLNGRQIQSKTLVKKDDDHTVSLDLKQHPVGIYYYSIVINNEKEYSGKLVLTE